MAHGGQEVDVLYEPWETKMTNVSNFYCCEINERELTGIDIEAPAQDVPCSVPSHQILSCRVSPSRKRHRRLGHHTLLRLVSCSCLNIFVVERINERGLSPVQALLNRFGGFPASLATWNGLQYDLEERIGMHNAYSGLITFPFVSMMILAIDVHSCTGDVTKNCLDVIPSIDHKYVLEFLLQASKSPSMREGQ